MATASTTPVGLRDRKRTETRARIEEAAVSLVLRDGLEAATVAAISERADVSPRTFFNYFDSKDSALIGMHLDHDSEPVTLAPDGDLVPSVIDMLMDLMGASLESSAAVHTDRLEVIRRHPEVLGSQLAQINARADRLTAVIRERLAARPPDGAPTADLALHAELVLALCGSAVRAAVREWTAEGSTRPIETVHRRAVALVTQTARSL